MTGRGDFRALRLEWGRELHYHHCRKHTSFETVYDRLFGSRHSHIRQDYNRTPDKNSYGLKRPYVKFSPTNSTAQSARLVPAASTHAFPARRDGSPKVNEITAVTDIEIATARASLNDHGLV